MAFALRYAALLRDSLHILLLSDFFVKRFYKKAMSQQTVDK